ncbi:hypothetical protein LJR231_005531 [Phyllobacterium sp. LjRoot231]|uniref:acyl-CoA thioesterase n=1 Tax=Phyllobacterium sp. LjRoot231 TaxID=3342289 RepID=UPI003ECF6569
MKIEFRRPSRVDDLLTIETKTGEISGARAHLAQTIWRGGDILVEARVECALIDGDGRQRRFTKGGKCYFVRKTLEPEKRSNAV